MDSKTSEKIANLQMQEEALEKQCQEAEKKVKQLRTELQIVRQTLQTEIRKTQPQWCGHQCCYHDECLKE